MKNCKTMVIRLLSLCLVLAALVAITPTAFASENTTSSNPPMSEQITPRIDETGWYYRTYNGLFQKRLWSYTEGKWLTDWITVGTVIE